MAKVKTSISIDEELFKEITEMSTEQDRSFSKQISHLAKKGKEAVYQADLEKIRAELAE
jgi:predicted CopG family antitoxin